MEGYWQAKSQTILIIFKYSIDTGKSYGGKDPFQKKQTGIFHYLKDA